MENKVKRGRPAKDKKVYKRTLQTNAVVRITKESKAYSMLNDLAERLELPKARIMDIAIKRLYNSEFKDGVAATNN